MLLVDDYNRDIWVVMLLSKDITATNIKHFVVAAETECGRHLYMFCIDRGREFTPSLLGEYFADLWRQWYLTPSY